MGAFGQRIPFATRTAIGALVDRARAHEHDYPPQALIEERAVLVETTDALYAYYLAEDGGAYSIDMDSSRSAEVVTDVERIRWIYERAAAQHPALAALREVPLVARRDPHAAFVASFRELAFFDPTRETIEAAIERHAHYFADRLLEPGPAYVYQRMPDEDREWITLQLVDVGEPDDQTLELHARRSDRGTVVEILHRGNRSAIVAYLRRPALGRLVRELVIANLR